MGAAISAGAVDEGALVQTLKCHACDLNWRQPAASEDDGPPQCPECRSDFVERLSLGIAARPVLPPGLAINPEVLRQAMLAQMAAGEEGSAGAEPGFSVAELLMNMRMEGAAAGAGPREASADEDPELHEALSRSMRDSEMQAKLPPPASKRAISLLPTKKWRAGPGVEGEGDTCCVCSETYKDGDEVTWMPCQHLIHAACLRPWLEATNSCPVCRFEIATDDPEYESKRKGGGGRGKTKVPPVRSVGTDSDRARVTGQGSRDAVLGALGDMDDLRQVVRGGVGARAAGGVGLRPSQVQARGRSAAEAATGDSHARRGGVERGVNAFVDAIPRSEDGLSSFSAAGGRGGAGGISMPTNPSRAIARAGSAEMAAPSGAVRGGGIRSGEVPQRRSSKVSGQGWRSANASNEAPDSTSRRGGMAGVGARRSSAAPKQ